MNYDKNKEYKTSMNSQFDAQTKKIDSNLYDYWAGMAIARPGNASG